MQNCRNASMTRQSHRQTSCDSVEHLHKDALNHMPIAMAYVPWQTWRNIYDAEKGFHRGTIFHELDLPFRGIGGCQQ